VSFLERFSRLPHLPFRRIIFFPRPEWPIHTIPIVLSVLASDAKAVFRLDFRPSDGRSGPFAAVPL